MIIRIGYAWKDFYTIKTVPNAYNYVSYYADMDIYI